MLLMATITLEAKGLDKLIRKLQAASRERVFIDALNSGVAHLKHWIDENRLSGRPGLIHRTGHLKRMVMPIAAKRIGDVIQARVNAGAIYSRIHEFGGTIVPKNKPFLAWKDPDSGKWRFAKKVTIPARPFMGPALRDKDNQQFVMNELIMGLRNAIARQE